MKIKMHKSIWLSVMVLTFLTIFSSCQKEPTASFTVSSASVNVGEIVAFTNTSTDGDSYEWDFGDAGTSTSVSPTHTYNTAGTYTVTLTAFSKNEKKSDKATESITVFAGKLIDSRDEQVYDIVIIGEQWWMAENLNYGTMINGTQTQTDNGTPEKYCYENNASNCNTLGALYQWNELMQYSTTQGVQGLCPAGWHIPTDAEWMIMEEYLGMCSGTSTGPPKCSGATGYRGTDQGTQIKTGGTSGFDAKLAGYRYSGGSFGCKDDFSYFWTSFDNTGSEAWKRELSSSSPMIDRKLFDKSPGFSVRCVKN